MAVLLSMAASDIGTELDFVNFLVLPCRLCLDCRHHPLYVFGYNQRHHHYRYPPVVDQLVQVPKSSNTATGSLGCNHAVAAQSRWAQLPTDNVYRPRIFDVWAPEICMWVVQAIQLYLSQV